ncbi:MAG: hypothetical protein GNW80_01745 [Asgard group archaeon]|nr:hypothetical protein [Asgard group archaeon]
MNTNTRIQNASAESSLLYSEDFSSDVFSSSDWVRTDNSVFVDTTNGWLHISSDTDYDDYASFVLSWESSFTIIIRSRSNGGRGYRMPAFEFYNNQEKTFYVTCIDEWIFPQSNGSINYLPPSENIWWDIKIEFNSDSQILFAKNISTNAWNKISENNIENLDFTSLRIRQNWDATIDIDFIEIYIEDPFQFYEPFNSNDVWISSNWTRSGDYYSIDEKNGWLHKSLAGHYEDSVDYSISLPFPFTIEYRGRLTSGGRDYTFPAFHFVTKDSLSFSFVYGYSQKGQWRFIGEYVDSSLGPHSEGIWWSAKIEFNINNQTLYSKSDSATEWSFVAFREYNISDGIVSFGFHGSWDAIIDIDYVAIDLSLSHNPLLQNNDKSFLDLYLIFVPLAAIISVIIIVLFLYFMLKGETRYAKRTTRRERRELKNFKKQERKNARFVSEKLRLVEKQERKDARLAKSKAQQDKKLSEKLLKDEMKALDRAEQVLVQILYQTRRKNFLITISDLIARSGVKQDLVVSIINEQFVRQHDIIIDGTTIVFPKEKEKFIYNSRKIVERVLEKISLDTYTVSLDDFGQMTKINPEFLDLVLISEIQNKYRFIVQNNMIIFTDKQAIYDVIYHVKTLLTIYYDKKEETKETYDLLTQAEIELVSAIKNAKELGFADEVEELEFHLKQVRRHIKEFDVD